MRLFIVFFSLVISWQTSAQNLISSEPLGFISETELEDEFGIEMDFGVSLFKVLYTTQDLDGMQVTASGLLIAPLEVGRIFPKLICHHGTVNSKSDVPSNLAGGHELGLVFGGSGYITLMPDFLGLGESPGFHPYVHADSEARASVDMLLAVDQELLDDLGTDYIANEQLFLTGYSQGGHACMATHRLLQNAYGTDYPVTAAAPMSGPYDISGVMLEETVLNEEPYFYPAYLGWSSLMVREAYGVYNDMEALFKPPYAAEVDAFYAGDITLSDLNTFMIDSLTASVGGPIMKHMMHDSIIDLITNQPDHPFITALQDNDLFAWTPQCPTRMFYCQGDDQVPYQNSVITLDTMEQLGAPDIGAIDVDPSADHVGCIVPAVTLGLLYFATYQDIGFWLNTEGVTLVSPKFQLAPNPAAEGEVLQVTLDSGLMSPSTVNIWNSLGELVYQATLPPSTSTTDLQIRQGLSAGIYFVEIRVENRKAVSRLLIQPGR